MWFSQQTSTTPDSDNSFDYDVRDMLEIKFEPLTEENNSRMPRHAKHYYDADDDNDDDADDEYENDDNKNNNNNRHKSKRLYQQPYSFVMTPSSAAVVSKVIAKKSNGGGVGGVLQQNDLIQQIRNDSDNISMYSTNDNITSHSRIVTRNVPIFDYKCGIEKLPIQVSYPQTMIVSPHSGDFVYKEWKTSGLTLKNYMNDLIHAITFSAQHKKYLIETYEHCEYFINNFIKEITKKTNKKFNVTPWGDNAEYFLFDCTKMLVFYIILTKNVESRDKKINVLRDLAITAIFSLLDGGFDTPLGYTMKNYQKLYILGPYLVAKYLSVDEITFKRLVWQSGKIRKIKQYFGVPLQRKLGQMGLMQDYGFFETENCVVSYRNFFEINVDFIEYYLHMDSDFIEFPDVIMERIKTLIYHPHIQLTILSFSDAPFMHDTKHIPSVPMMGIKTIPSIRILRYFTARINFTVQMAARWMSYNRIEFTLNEQNYECTEFTRNCFTTASSSPYFTFPQAGLMGPLVKEYITFAKRDTRVLSTQFEVANSQVFTHQNFGFAYQQYVLAHSAYIVNELIQIDGEKQEIYIDVMIQKKIPTAESLYYYTYKHDESLTNPSIDALEPIHLNKLLTQINITYDLKRNKVKVVQKTYENNPVDLPVQVKSNTHDYAIVADPKIELLILHYKKKPVVACYKTPKVHAYPEEIKSTAGDTFIFDALENQYVIQH